MGTIATIIYRPFAIFAFAFVFSGLLPMAHAVSPALAELKSVKDL
jgi:hypothetical protein